VFEAMRRPFIAGQWQNARLRYALQVAWAIDGCGTRTLQILLEMEPNVPWTKEHLRMRRDCYVRAGLAELAGAAARDWMSFTASEPLPLLAR
jgi:hypothetical protein